MSETLFIRLGSQAYDAIQWLVWSEQQQDVIASGELTHANELTHLTEKASQRNVIGFVPANDIALKRLKVPGKSSRAITAAAPYMLEDELAQEVESLFFAYGNVAKDQDEHNCFVAAVDREQLIQWQQWLRDADILCKTLIPDVLAMPYIEDKWSAITLNNQIILRQGIWQGAVIEANVWELISQQWQQAATTSESAESEGDEGTSLPTTVINSYAALPDTEGVHIESMPEELPLALLAQHANSKLVNLLQGEFQVKEKRSAQYTNWLWVAGIAGVALLLNVALKGAELIKLNNENEAIEQNIVQVYKDTFPQTKRVRVSTIKSQLKRKLSEVGGASQSVGFLEILNKVQPAFNEISVLRPESLKFDAKRQELRIQAMSSNYQSFEQFKTLLENQSLTVSQGAQNNLGDNQVSGSFIISFKGAR